MAGTVARPYRDFLTPSLHRRFTSAAAIGLTLCWVEAILMAEPGLFWSWFPLGFTGTRALLLFVSSLAVYILRVAQLHFGQRTTTFAFETFWQQCLSRNTFQTLFWYLTSAFLFSEVYIFSTSRSANLAWIDPGRSYERPRLNERPVLLRSLFFILAVAQSAVHLYRDYDLVSLSKHANSKSPSPLAQLQAAIPLMVQRSTSLVIVTATTGPLIYFVFLRSIAWSVALKIGRSLFTLSKQVKPSGLTDVTTLMVRFAWSAFLLTIIWEVSNQAFSIYTAQEPLKKGQPLTTDSKDPNGSLIAGLKAKKDIPRNIAFWELNMITANFPDRRATLYADTDRTGGSTWSQVSQLCLAEIQSVSQRIQDSLGPPRETATETTAPQHASSLPKIAQPLHSDNIFNPAPPPTSALEIVQDAAGSLAKSYGSSPGPSQVGPRAQKLLEYGGNNLLLDDKKRQQLSRSNLSSQANGYIIQVLRSPIGALFRRSFSRQANAVIFGVPYSSASRIINAVEAISSLVVSSLKEDRLGAVQKDIATIARVLSSTIEKVQTFTQTLPPHWTDVDFNGEKHVPEVEELLTVLRTGLAQILMTFGEYAPNLGINRVELKAWKDLARSGHEMEMKKR